MSILKDHEKTNKQIKVAKNIKKHVETINEKIDELERQRQDREKSTNNEFFRRNQINAKFSRTELSFDDFKKEQ